MEALFDSMATALGRSLILAPVMLAPLGYLCWRLRRHRVTHLHGKEDPFRKMPLRPPGESVRERLAELEEAYQDLIPEMFIVGWTAVAMVMVSESIRQPLAFACIFVFVLVLTIRKGRRLLYLAREIRNHRLGYKGERIVGETLNQLMLQGFRVFHDIPFVGYNIDHVIVGRQGVFAVETKSWRKPRDENGVKEYKVCWNGRDLQFPTGTQNGMIEQTRLNAQSLSAYLSEALSEEVTVKGILVLPGWMVERTGNGPVNVLNENEVRNSFKNLTVLTQKQIEQIASQLSEKCRLLPEPKESQFINLNRTQGRKHWAANPKSVGRRRESKAKIQR